LQLRDDLGTAALGGAAILSRRRNQAAFFRAYTAAGVFAYCHVGRHPRCQTLVTASLNLRPAFRVLTDAVSFFELRHDPNIALLAVLEVGPS
jgi:hypothetical protein